MVGSPYKQMDLVVLASGTTSACFHFSGYFLCLNMEFIMFVIGTHIFCAKSALIHAGKSSLLVDLFVSILSRCRRTIPSYVHLGSVEKSVIFSNSIWFPAIVVKYSVSLLVRCLLASCLQAGVRFGDLSFDQGEAGHYSTICHCCYQLS